MHVWSTGCGEPAEPGKRRRAAWLGSAGPGRTPPAGWSPWSSHSRAPMDTAAATHLQEEGNWRSIVLWEWDWQQLDYRTCNRAQRWWESEKDEAETSLDSGHCLFSQQGLIFFTVHVLTKDAFYLYTMLWDDKCEIILIFFLKKLFGSIRTFMGILLSLKIVETFAVPVLRLYSESCCLLAFMWKTAAHQTSDKNPIE